MTFRQRSESFGTSSSRSKIRIALWSSEAIPIHFPPLHTVNEWPLPMSSSSRDSSELIRIGRRGAETRKGSSAGFSTSRVAFVGFQIWRHFCKTFYFAIYGGQNKLDCLFLARFFRLVQYLQVGSRHRGYLISVMNKLQLTGRNLGRIFNSRRAFVCATHLFCHKAKMLKTLQTTCRLFPDRFLVPREG